ncbi:MAG: hypothetical protein FWG81_10110, partial [Betaproteobacteria bacterium]|nr:hypothetical protein [Betaproteobacteria bacterium]
MTFQGTPHMGRNGKYDATLNCRVNRLSSGDDEAALLASLQALLQQQEQIDKALSDNAELIRRYEELQSASAYSETALPYSDVWVGFGESKLDIYPIRRLMLQKATLAALSGDREPLLDFLERDISFWRLVMKSDSMLITSMSASIVFMLELRLLRTLLAQIDFSTPKLERLRYLLTPLSAEEQSLLRTLEYECNGFANFLLTEEKYYFHPGMRSSGIFLHKWLFQPQATVNIFAERTRLWKELASLSSFGFAVRHDAV